MKETLYRIIDANFNRAREALRVMEEYCRFGLNNPDLAAKAKASRHLLCDKIKAFDPLLLLANRDVEGDVGKGLQVDGQLKRTSIEDCFSAASKRASEALRALAESTQAIAPEITATMEKLRFDVYSLEKQAVLSADTKTKLQSVRLCVLINATVETDQAGLLKLAKICIDNGADCLQLRAKGLTDAQQLFLAEQFSTLCRKSDTVSIINDRVDIALLAEADGVHLGQDEISVSDAKKLAKRPLIVGVSTHNLDELHRAIDSRCDYVGLGPVFSSPTKPMLKVSGIDYIRQALPLLEATGVFHLAIGGINSSNLDPLLKSGAKAIAVSAAVSSSQDPDESCKALKEMLLNVSS